MFDEEDGAGALDHDLSDAKDGGGAGSKEGVEGDVPVVGIPEVGGGWEVLKMGHGEEDFADGSFTVGLDQEVGGAFVEEAFEVSGDGVAVVFLGFFEEGELVLLHEALHFLAFNFAPLPFFNEVIGSGEGSELHGGIG